MNAPLEHAAADPTLPEFSFTEVCQAFDALEKHPTELKHLNLGAASPRPTKTQTWRPLLTSGALTEVEELWVDPSFDADCARMLEEWAPKLARLRWRFRSEDLFAYVQATSSSSELTTQ